MKIIDIKKIKYNKVLEIISDSLNKSEIITIPTDTIYGLSALASDKKAIDKVYKVKNRPYEKKFILLVSDLEMAKKYAKINSKQEKYLQSVWPGPVTVILEAKSLAKDLSSKEGAIAIRNPNSNFLIDVIKKVDEAIISTSVNISSHDNLNRAVEIQEYFQAKKNKPDLIINSDVGANKSSIIVNITDINNPIILRR
ncbi:MAG TPA: L-threonylcarbamoyladenylate synthase [Patescibacteria group bacterium]|nr:L-threonylcarbamoyladenylate synthase [Patescibacteria group bacterium]